MVSTLTCGIISPSRDGTKASVAGSARYRFLKEGIFFYVDIPPHFDQILRPKRIRTTHHAVSSE